MDDRKCRNCGKPAYEHRAKTNTCPFGVKHRVHGWPGFYAKQWFEAVEETTNTVTKNNPMKSSAL